MKFEAADHSDGFAGFDGTLGFVSARTSLITRALNIAGNKGFE